MDVALAVFILILIRLILPFSLLLILGSLLRSRKPVSL